MVEKRRQHVGSGRSACDIPDVISFLMQNFSFQSRHRLLSVFQLCCLVINIPQSIHPVVTLELKGCAIDPKVFHDCLLLVQSYVLCPGYAHQSFFTIPTLDTVRGAIAGAEFCDCRFRLMVQILCY